MSSQIRVTDEFNNVTITVARDDTAEKLRAWFPDAPADVLGALNDLQVKLNRHEYTGEEEAFLGISIDLTPDEDDDEEDEVDEHADCLICHPGSGDTSGRENENDDIDGHSPVNR